MMVSVIIPIYNIEKYVEECIESIINQTYSDLEIILVDDGSFDNSGIICDQYAKIDSRIKVIHKENGGLVSARKAGLKIATGEFVVYVDGDDYISDKRDIDRRVEVITENRADVLVCSYYIAGKSVDNTCELVQNNVSNGIYKGEELCALKQEMLCDKEGRFFAIFPSVWTKMFRRELLMTYQLSVPDGISLGEDAAVSYFVMAASECIVVNNMLGAIFYRQVDTSITHSYSLKNNKMAEIQLLCDYMDMMLEKDERLKVLEHQLPMYKHRMLMDEVNKALNDIQSSNGEKISYLNNIIRKTQLFSDVIDCDNSIPFKEKLKLVLLKYGMVGLLVRSMWLYRKVKS